MMHETWAERVFVPGIERVAEFDIQAGDVVENKDLSAIAWIEAPHALLASDETSCLQWCEIFAEEREIRVGGMLRLGSDHREEMDIEAVAVDGNRVYVAGSHGAARKSGDDEPGRYRLCRSTLPTGSGVATEVVVGSLRGVFEADAKLAPYVGRPLQRKGLNVEGLAVNHGRMYAGLRAPNLEGDAFVVETGLDAPFEGEASSIRHALPLGAGWGVRDLIPIKIEDQNGGFLLLAGNAGCEPGDSPKTSGPVEDYDPARRFRLHFWDGRSHVEEIGELPGVKKSHNAESLLILGSGEGRIELLVLFDGPKGGSPTQYRLRLAR